MSRRIKMIWDFRGEDSKPIAEHHVIHLKQFAEKEGLSSAECDLIEVNPSYSITYITVPESKMIAVRDALKPHRGELIED